jgi:hypothetical protein
MVIENAKWFINPIDGKTKIAIMCKINGQDVSVPLDTANTDYQAIQEWVAKGNTIEEAD